MPKKNGKLARVTWVFPSNDGLVRMAEVKTSSTVVTRASRQRCGEIKTTISVLRRPINKLCRLEMDEEMGEIIITKT